jgi:hypothetical protein
MKPTKLLAMLGMGMIAACGGGGGGQVAGIDGGGTPTPVATVVSKGTITGFGSVIVNGVHYDSNGADITIDDNPGLESDLAVGDVVVVKGTLSSSGTSGSADSIDFDDAVEGPVSAIDLAGGTITADDWRPCAWRRGRGGGLLPYRRQHQRDSYRAETGGWRVRGDRHH